MIRPRVDRIGDEDLAHLAAQAVHDRVKRLALAQSADIHAKLVKAGVDMVTGRARLGEDTLGHTHRVVVTPAEGHPEYSIAASTVLIATGATHRVLPTAVPDGERILTWRQVYDLPDLPEHLIVVGSGVTGAEFASAYLAMGVEVTLVSSRDRVMPHEDADAAMAIERVFRAEDLEGDNARSSSDRLRRAAALSFHKDRSGDLIIVPKEDWLLAASVTTHGTQHDYDQRVPVIIFGASVKPGEYEAEATPADIVPTLAAVAGVRIAKTDGRVLNEAIAAPTETSKGSR